MQSVTERFLEYVKIYTTSDPENTKTPSTQRQFDLAHLLCEQLQAMGIENANVDAHGYVMAKILSNSKKDLPAVGFIAHMDTSPDCSGENVRPQIIENYDGSTIKLNDEYQLSPQDFPDLLKYVGQTLITTDGTTLLGADDKAGIAEIMAAAEFLMSHPEIEHGDVCIGFTPDEEIGRGVVKFDVERFGAEFAYTMDGGKIGELQYENFNAGSLKVKVHGRLVHPGDAKDAMINASEIAMEFHSMLPTLERPEYTEGYQGFYHLHTMSGEVEYAELNYIIRDHSRELFEDKKQRAEQIAEFLNKQHPGAKVIVELSDSYYNMKEQVEPVFHIVELAEQAMKSVGVTPLIEPIRGGTDGSNLSYMGLPCPNIFAGGHNFHGRFEFVPVASMEKAVEVIVAIVQLVGQK
ncbi:peptidase T [Culicoidibacter larvae]|uniref:Peptidase T n=1 Tax=Culicoidibacter larvae TaxID=2579976 RepID=A0A5R8QBI4_9FIRM|nr:peptidase T [Culicoidibacter larvae]TLG72472.1 peptidase T [Culicoidibacter larvae]